MDSFDFPSPKFIPSTDGLPELPEGYVDTSENADEVCIEHDGDFVCDLMSADDIKATHHAVAKLELYFKSLAQGFFSVAALLFRGNQVLSVSRKTDHEDIGLPGGKIEYGETPEQALIRELREETGVTALRFVPVFEDKCRIEHGKTRPARVYLVYSWEGEPTAVENAVVEWVSPERLFDPSNSFAGYNRKLFEHLNAQTNRGL
jgi:mutator protein MutT